MARFNFSVEDLKTTGSITSAVHREQALTNGPLRTTASASARPRVGGTTYDASSIMQGNALYMPQGFVTNQHMQSLSSDLGGLLRADGGVSDIVGGANNILGARASLLSYDILLNPGFNDGRFTNTSSGIQEVSAPGTGGLNPGSGRAVDMVAYAESQDGKTYIFGAEASPSDPNPSAFDCSELIEWSCAQVGVTFVDGSSAQIAACAGAGLEITVEEAQNIPGAILWRPGHIAISTGRGNETIEAKGRAYGVLHDEIGTRFSRAGKIPGLDYTDTTPPAEGGSGGGGNSNTPSGQSGGGDNSNSGSDDDANWQDIRFYKWQTTGDHTTPNSQGSYGQLTRISFAEALARGGMVFRRKLNLPNSQAWKWRSSPSDDWDSAVVYKNNSEIWYVHSYGNYR